jgi:phosphohistidine swiveling domain-containing protein
MALNFQLPLNPKHEIFRWGPLVIKNFYLADFNQTFGINYTNTYMSTYWPTSVVLFVNGQVLWLNDLKQLHKIGGRVFQKYIMDDDLYNKQKSNWQQVLNELHKQEDEIIHTDLIKLTDQDFINLLISTNTIILKFWLPTLPAELGNYGSIEILHKKLKKTTSDKKNIENIIRILTTSEKPTFYQTEELELQETDNIDKHQQKYFWLYNNYAGTEYLTKDFFQTRKNILEPNLRDKFNQRVFTIKQEKQKIINKYKLPADIIKTATRILDAMEFQDDRKKEIWIMQHYKKLLFDEIKRRLKQVNFDQFSMLELAEMMQGKKIKRSENFGFILHKGCVTELDQSTTKHYWEIYTKYKITQTNIIKGIIANKGKAIGKVQIIRDPRNQANEFQDGNILVAPMTSPDYVFLMKQATAIITDAGGLTSHAAIVSRELSKPCIVGTNIATQILQDGDTVEVDANQGIIKILK